MPAPSDLEKSILQDVSRDLRRAASALEYAGARLEQIMAWYDLDDSWKLAQIHEQIDQSVQAASKARGLARVRMQEGRNSPPVD